ncbi:MAG: AraC family transcriptional regulator [Ruminococcus sp.]|nr:AraC family transcriptional regulator [Ruminococcus sp.]
MALQECGLNLNRGSKELQPHGSPQFPCAGYSSYHTDRQEDVILWHWHEEIEMIYIESGRMKIKIPSKSFLLEKGDCIVINSNILHYGIAASECRLHSLVFSPVLITGNDDLVFAKKYIFPLLSCQSFSGSLIKAERNEKAAHWFCRAFEALACDCEGFEFIVREKLSRICFFLYQEFQGKIDQSGGSPDQDNLRIRKMLTYIHENFSDGLTLSDISGAADISERECLRCFQKRIQLSPIQYLIKYRIMQGAEMLRKDLANNISEIATLCGFDSPSNFAKTFKRFYGCTPREYRNREKRMLDNESIIR